MILFFLILVAASFISLVIQHFIPPLGAEGVRLILMPLVLFYGALALPFGLMLVLAFICGLMWDALTVQVIQTGFGPTASTTVEIALGWSILLYATLGSVMSGFKPLFKRGRWEVHCLVSGVCTSLIVLAEFLMLSVRRAAIGNAPFVFNHDIWWRIGGPGVLALLLAPLVFFVLNSFAALVGYNPRKVNREEDL